MINIFSAIGDAYKNWEEYTISRDINGNYIQAVAWFIILAAWFIILAAGFVILAAGFVIPLAVIIAICVFNVFMLLKLVHPLVLIILFFSSLYWVVSDQV